MNNNYWPARYEPTRFQLYKLGEEEEEEELENPMQRAKRAKKK